MMKDIVHAENVLDHLEAFGHHAHQLNLPALHSCLLEHENRLSKLLTEAHDWGEKRAQARFRLKALEKKASDFYSHVGFQLPYVLSEAQCIPLCTGRHLNVINRLRYRGRALAKIQQPGDASAVLAADHQRFLAAYDGAVDDFLRAAGEFQHAQRCALQESQQIREILVQAKAQLLEACSLGDESYKSIKKRVVRTKRALGLGALQKLPTSVGPIYGFE
ncbi:MAG: hypothetical protein CMH56_06755 [Myxococcales bacterium]|nr:hypothetical protein [Myxococcales bacterium]|tara:strand:- start:1766 stop:2422 length:657 start_codon:yes stop_codon:yes gene_type:complete